MAELKDLLQSADWKAEKHVPVIELPEQAKASEIIKVSVTVGKEIAHPNKTEHHIRWIEVYFLPEGEKFALQIGRAEFCAHGESAKGADTSSVYTHPKVELNFKTERSGVVYASSYCNIHGLWQSAQAVKITA